MKNKCLSQFYPIDRITAVLIFLFMFSINSYSQTPENIISEGLPVIVSSAGQGTDPFMGNDGNAGTRWGAINDNYPQTYTIDLGNECTISKTIIEWYKAEGRAYRSLIESSLDGVKYTQIADNTASTSFGYTTNTMNAKGRYVRVNVTGSTG